MQKYSKTMQIKQFSLAGIPLHTVIESSQSEIAASDHKQNPSWPSRSQGWGWAGSGKAAPTWKMGFTQRDSEFSAKR